MPDTRGSSQLQWIHRRKQLSPSAGGTARKTYLTKGKKSHARNQRSETNVSKTALQTPRPEKEGKEVLQGLGQRFPCIAWRRP